MVNCPEPLLPGCNELKTLAGRIRSHAGVFERFVLHSQCKLCASILLYPTLHGQKLLEVPGAKTVRHCLELR